MQYQYAPAGELLTKVTPEGTTSYSYDPATKYLSGITAANESTLGLTYNGSLLNQENIHLPFSSSDYQLGISYDDELRISSHEIAGTLIDYRYDFDGFLKGVGDWSVFWRNTSLCQLTQWHGAY